MFRLVLDRTGHTVDKPVIFHVETRAAGLGLVDVVVVNPYGQTEEVCVDQNDLPSREFVYLVYHRVS